MMITPELLPGWLLWLADLAFLAVMVGTVLRAPWNRLLAAEQVHVYLGTCVALMVLWTLKAGVDPGLGYHFIGATLFTLMFGWELSLVAFALVLLGTAINLAQDWSVYAVNFLIKGGVPIAVSALMLRLAQARLPRHLFVYIFFNAFLGGGIAVLANALAVFILFAAAGTYTPAHLGAEYLAFSPLMMFGEAWMTGALITIFIGYRPTWVSTYSDDVYLRGAGH